MEKGGWQGLLCKTAVVNLQSPAKPTALLDTRTLEGFPVFSNRDELNDILDEVLNSLYWKSTFVCVIIIITLCVYF